MIEFTADSDATGVDGEAISFLALGAVLVRRRRLIGALVIAGAITGLAASVLSKRVYRSSATFIPQGTESGMSGLGLAASQFGIRIPTSGGGWGPPVYVELLSSRTLLEPLALDTVVVAEEQGRRVALMDLFEVKAATHKLRLERTVRMMERIAVASEDRRLGAVRVAVVTHWPSVSLQLAQNLLDAVNRFNLQTRKSQAMAERQFVEARADEAERALREAEDRLQSFLQRNRIISGSSEIAFEQDRLQRDVSLRQQVYTSLAQNREEAKVREVRETPVLTLLEAPHLAAVAESRKTVRNTLLGAVLGGLVGALGAFLLDAIARARASESEEAREFFRLLEHAVPRVFRRRRFVTEREMEGGGQPTGSS